MTSSYSGNECMPVSTIVYIYYNTMATVYTKVNKFAAVAVVVVAAAAAAAL